MFVQPAQPAVAATCDRQYYTTTEDRQRVLEQRELIREHHPFEKEFVVETKPTGRERALERYDLCKAAGLAA